MKILVIADCHLASEFDEKKYNYLAALIKKADQVILNGDFWDHYITSFDRFINSPWKKLFPLLKSKKTVYIYGNHDQKKYCDERVSFFSIIQTNRYKLVSGNKKFIIEHGNRLFKTVDEIFNSRLINLFVVYVINPIQYQIIKRFDGKLLNYSLKQTNKVMKRKLRRELRDGQIYVCGHTHFAEIDLKHNFINTGINNYGLGQHVWIENGKISFKEKWYD